VVENSWRVSIGVVVLALMATSLAAQNETRRLTPAQQQFELGLELHLGLGDQPVDIDKALRHYLLALRADSQFFEAHVNAGKAYYARKDYRRAKVHFSNAVKIARSRQDISASVEAEISSDLGGCYFKEGNLKEAEKWFRGAVGLDSTLPEGHYNLINLLMSDGREEEARRHIEVAAVSAPSERYAIFEGRLTTQESYAEWNPLWLKIVAGVALAGVALSFLLRAVRSGRRHA
jgi:tetratricopeptide (TPR) repeat protein